LIKITIIKFLGNIIKVLIKFVTILNKSCLLSNLIVKDSHLLYWWN